MGISDFSVQEVIAKVIWGESRNQPYIGQVAIANVIMNRANHGGWWGNTPREVCTKPMQFSCLNPNDPNLPKLLDVDATDKIYAICLEIAENALADDLNDFSEGSDSYTATGLVTPWNKNLTPVVVIGAHSFYRTV